MLPHSAHFTPRDALSQVGADALGLLARAWFCAMVAEECLCVLGVCVGEAC